MVKGLLAYALWCVLSLGGRWAYLDAMNRKATCSRQLAHIVPGRCGPGIRRCGRYVTCLAVVFWGLAGCTVGPDYVEPQVAAPEAWSGVGEAGGFAATTRPATSAADLSQWWATLQDPVLTSLIERSVESNLDVRLADARVRQAMALRGVAFADLFPSVDLESSFSHQRSSRNRSAGRDSRERPSITFPASFSSASGLSAPSANIRYGDTSATIAFPALGTGGVPTVNVSRSRTLGGSTGGFQRDSNTYETGFGASWEIDVWGGVRRAIEAADADIVASVEDRRAVLVDLAAQVARNYVTLRRFQRQLEITYENIGIQQNTLRSIQTRFAAGVATGTDVLQARGQLERTESDIPGLQAGILTAIYRLSVLLGHEPAHLLVELSEVQAIPATPALLAVGVPSELLRRRPDIRAAERQLAAETARIGVEVADLFPRMSLTGSFGLQTADVDQYAERDSLGWSFGPAVRWRVLDFGRILSSIAVQEESQRQALIRYQQIVLNALEQVEASLANFATERRRTEVLEDVNEVNRRAFEMAKSEYAVGMLNFLSVLDTQRTLFSTQTQLVQSREQTLLELINVYQALGGGWPAGDDAGASMPPS